MKKTSEDDRQRAIERYSSRFTAIDDLRFVVEPEPGDVLLNDMAADLLRQRYEEIRQILEKPDAAAAAATLAYGIPAKDVVESLARARRDFEECAPTDTRMIAVKRPVWRRGATA